MLVVSPTELEIKMYEAYDAGYQVFLENWQVNRQIALDLIQKYLQPSHPEISVLSVGAGPGDFDIQVIRTLKQYISPQLALRYVAVEPNPLHRQRYEQKINTSEFPDLRLELSSEKIEEFHTDDKFDIIHFTHSMYHMPNHEKHLIQRGLEILKEDGFLIITLSSSQAVIFDTIVRYAALTGQGFSEMLQMEKMQTIVDELGLSYELVHYPEYMDIKLCFDEASLEGKALMDFFCQADSSLLSHTQRQEILNMLQSQVIEKETSKLVPLPGATMVIHK